MAAAQPACAAARAAEYPRLGDGTYLNAASFGVPPVRALTAARAIDDLRTAGRLTPRDFAPALGHARAACARLIDAAETTIALTPHTTAGLHVAVDVVRQRAGARRTIIMPDGEFPANVYGWLGLEREGFRVERLPVDDQGCPREDVLLDRLRRGDVAALTISAVQFATGYRADLNTLGAACADAGALFVVDAIQALGAMPLSVRQARIDVLACGGQKWLCGPFGSGFVHIREGLCDELEPAIPGWLGFRSSGDFTRLLDYEWDLWPDARRFETGSLGFQDFAGLAAAVELILELGVDVIQTHLRALHEPLLAWTHATEAAHPLVADAGRRAGILSIAVRDAGRAHDRLSAAGVTLVRREGALRFAPHFYNTVEEIERVVDVLSACEP